MFEREDIVCDLQKLNVRDFYLKYLLRAENWYFEKILEIPKEDILHTVDDFKLLVSDVFGVGFNNIAMVGSGKTGYSFSPKNYLRPFVIDGDNQSDIDIAIISSKLFHQYWELFRKGYDITNKRLYDFISRGIYRGYISENDIMHINECRIQWVDKSRECTKKLQRTMYFKHEIHYRIYNEWSDLEEYHKQSIIGMKEKIGASCRIKM